MEFRPSTPHWTESLYRADERTLVTLAAVGQLWSPREDSSRLCVATRKCARTLQAFGALNMAVLVLLVAALTIDAS